MLTATVSFSAVTLLLGGRKGIRPVKLNDGVLSWLSVWVRCRFAYGPAEATATHYLLLQYIQTRFTFLVPAEPGSPEQRPIKQVLL